MNKYLSLRFITTSLLILVLSGGFFWSGVYSANAEQATLPLKELRTFSDVYGRIKTSYVDQIDDATLIEGAIDGMLAKLDPYSVFLKKKSYEELKVNTTGKFGGLGIEVDKEGGFVHVIAPIDDTPAERAGIQAGDLISEINNQSTKSLSLQEAVDKMRGEVGTTITLTVLRKKEQETEEETEQQATLYKKLSINLTRAVIKVQNSRHALLEPDFGYVRISKFQQRTSLDLMTSIQELNRENKKPLQGLIVDLRNNPGGMLNEAINVADLFLPAKTSVVYTKGRIEGSTIEYKTSAPDQTDGLTVMLLINKGSASASEIVAGALQDNKRAMILGTQSFGKGSVQTVHPFDAEHALKLTTAKYYTPSGTSIQDVGITPDLKYEFEQLSDEQLKARNKISRKDLKDRLAYDSQVQQAIKELKKLALKPT